MKINTCSGKKKKKEKKRGLCVSTHTQDQPGLTSVYIIVLYCSALPNDGVHGATRMVLKKKACFFHGYSQLCVLW